VPEWNEVEERLLEEYRKKQAAVAAATAAAPKPDVDIQKKRSVFDALFGRK